MMRCLAACTAVRPNCSKGTSSSRTSPGWNSGSSKRASSRAICVPGSSTASTTVLRTTMRIEPFISSMPISARTLGPYRFTRAACSPSLSRSISSVRSSCLVLVSSLIAETTSVVLAILVPQSSVVVGRQARIPHVRQSIFLLRSSLRLEDDRLCARYGHDARAHPPQSRQLRIDVAPHKAHPMAVPLQRPLDARARDLEHVAVAQGTTCIQPLFQCTAGTGAVLDRDVPWRTVDSDLNERSVRRAADAKVGEIEPQHFQPG